MIFLAVSATKSSEVASLPSQSPDPSNNQFLDGTTLNLTYLLAGQLSDQVVSQLDPENPLPPEEVFLQQLQSGVLNEALSSNDTSKIFGVEVSDSDILVSDDNSEKAMLSYFAQLSNIISQAKQVALKTVNDSGGKFDRFGNVAQAYERAFAETRKLIVPSYWKEEHKRELELIGEHKKAYEAFSLAEQDPLKGWLAVQHLIVLSQEGLQLEKDIKAKGSKFTN